MIPSKDEVKKCQKCGGTKYVYDNDSMISSQVCPKCNGTGIEHKAEGSFPVCNIDGCKMPPIDDSGYCHIHKPAEHKAEKICIADGICKFQKSIEHKAEKDEYTNNGMFTKGVDPEVTCWHCGKTFLCDCMDATCRICNAPYDKSRCKEFNFTPKPADTRYELEEVISGKLYGLIIQDRKEFSGNIAKAIKDHIKSVLMGMKVVRTDDTKCEWADGYEQALTDLQERM